MIIAVNFSNLSNWREKPEKINLIVFSGFSFQLLKLEKLTAMIILHFVISSVVVKSLISQRKEKSNHGCTSQINFDLLPVSGCWSRQIVPVVHVSTTKNMKGNSHKRGSWSHISYKLIYTRHLWIMNNLRFSTFNVTVP